MPALVVIFAYVLGTFPTAIVVGVRRGFDPTASGSGNPGASNVYRTAGRRAGVVVLVGDLLKGALAAGVGLTVGGSVLGLVAGGTAVLGHVFPVTRGFRGGKGVATAAGTALVVHPLVSVGLGVAWVAVARVARTASLASIAVAALYPAGLALSGRDGVEVALAGVLAAVVVLRHVSNIRRLVRRDEASLAAGPSDSRATAP